MAINWTKKALHRKSFSNIMKNDFKRSNGHRKNLYEIITVANLDTATLTKLETFKKTINYLIALASGKNLKGDFSQWVRWVKYTDGKIYQYEQLLGKVSAQNGYDVLDIRADGIKKELNKLPIIMTFKVSLNINDRVYDRLHRYRNDNRLKVAHYSLTAFHQGYEELFDMDDLVDLEFQFETSTNG